MKSNLDNLDKDLSYVVQQITTLRNKIVEARDLVTGLKDLDKDGASYYQNLIVFLLYAHTLIKGNPIITELRIDMLDKSVCNSLYASPISSFVNLLTSLEDRSYAKHFGQERTSLKPVHAIAMFRSLNGDFDEDDEEGEEEDDYDISGALINRVMAAFGHKTPLVISELSGSVEDQDLLFPIWLMCIDNILNDFHIAMESDGSAFTMRRK